MRETVDLGLNLNAGKYEIISSDMTLCGTLLVSLPGTQVVPSSRIQLLGSPIVNGPCIFAVLAEKVDTLRRLGERLKLLSAHDALILLQNSFIQPKLLHIFRTAPCFRLATLATYDDCLCEILGSVTNPLLERETVGMDESASPCEAGRIGDKERCHCCPSAFLTFTHFTAELVHAILLTHIMSHLDKAQSLWSAGHNCQLPKGTAACRQALWDYVRTF